MAKVFSEHGDSFPMTGDVVVTHSPEETLLLGEQFARQLQGGDVVAFDGELGTGKTHFIKGICRGLGFDGVVSSPTFALIQEYATTPQSYHVDLYRLETASQVSALGLEELMQPTSIVFIEWPNLAAPILPGHTWFVRCTHGDGDQERTYTISGGA